MNRQHAHRPSHPLLVAARHVAAGALYLAIVATIVAALSLVDVR